MSSLSKAPSLEEIPRIVLTDYPQITSFDSYVANINLVNKLERTFKTLDAPSSFREYTNAYLDELEQKILFQNQDVNAGGWAEYVQHFEPYKRFAAVPATELHRFEGGNHKRSHKRSHKHLRRNKYTKKYKN